MGDERLDLCATCGGIIGYIEGPNGPEGDGWWAHASHPDDDHDAVPKHGPNPNDPDEVEAWLLEVGPWASS